MPTAMTSAIETQFRTIDGLTIRYAESEQRSEHALLLSPWPESLFAFDQMWERHHNWLGRRSQGLQRQPSEYLRTNTYFTFQKDPVAVETRERVGLDRLMWASDYPHSDSTWPHSQKVIERDFAGVPDDDLRAILHDNAAKLYNL